MLEPATFSDVVPQGLRQRLLHEVDRLMRDGIAGTLLPGEAKYQPCSETSPCAALYLGSVISNDEDASNDLTRIVPAPMPAVLSGLVKLMTVRKVSPMNPKTIISGCTVFGVESGTSVNIPLSSKTITESVPVTRELLVLPTEETLNISFLEPREYAGDMTTEDTQSAPKIWSKQITAGSVLKIPDICIGRHNMQFQVSGSKARQFVIILDLREDSQRVETDSVSDGGDSKARKESKQQKKEAAKLLKKTRKAHARQVKEAQEAANRTIVPYGMFKSVPIPWELLVEGSKPDDPLVTPQVEVEHVKDLYNAIAPHWHGTRYKAWPKVEEFIRSQSTGSFFGDIGCGNGKNIPACNDMGYTIGCDLSIELIKICSSLNFEVGVADVMTLPYRSEVFDAVIMIAVMHHISSLLRRVRALSELIRVLRVGGQALVYAWAMEQENAKSGHKFTAPDVLVPWHFAANTNQSMVKGASDTAKHNVSDRAVRAEADADKSTEDRTATNTTVNPADETKKSPAVSNDQTETSSSLPDMRSMDEDGNMVFQRYCHVYQQGELEAMAALLPNVEVVKVYYDTGNWAMIMRKTAPSPTDLPDIPKKLKF